MKISDQLRCLFSAEITETDDSYVFEVPEQEVRLENLKRDEQYRVAITSTPSEDEDNSETTSERDTTQEKGQRPPVEEGETRRVEIDSIGDQGDGITRVERGFVVIVPDTKQGERVDVEIIDVQENVAFAEVKERINYYD